jgi:hypothetical protein
VRRYARGRIIIALAGAAMIGSSFVSSPVRAAQTDLSCDVDCVASGSWSLGPVGIDQGRAIGVGRVTTVLKNGIEVDFGGTKARLLREGDDAAVWETPYEGLQLAGGLAPHTSLFDLEETTSTGQPIAVGQPVRVEGGVPPASSGGDWTGPSHVRFNWWEGRQYFVAGKSLDQLFAVAVGTVVTADANGVQLQVADGVSIRRLWVAAYPDTPIGRTVGTAGAPPYDGLAVEYDFEFAPSLLHSGDPLLIWLGMDTWANTNPHRAGTTDGDLSCGKVAGREGCRWSAGKIAIVPALAPTAKPNWWDEPAYAWSNVNPGVGADDLVASCQFNSEASGRVVATDASTGTVTILSSEQLVSMTRPAGAPLPLVGEEVLLKGGGCIENGHIQRPERLLIAPRSATGGLVGSTPSSHVLAVSVDRTSPMPVTEERTSQGMGWKAPVSRFNLAVTVDGTTQMPVDGTMQVLTSEDGWLEPSAPGAESITAATVRRLARGEQIAPWSMRILRRPPAGSTPKALTIMVLLVDGAQGYASATTTITLEGGAYPAPRGTGDATFLAALSGASDIPPDGLIVSRGGTSVEISLAPDAYAKGANNWAVLGCGPQDSCATGVLDNVLSADQVDVVHLQGVGSGGPTVDVSVPLGEVGVTYLYHYPSVTDGEQWRGIGFSPADFVWGYLGLDTVCGGALKTEAGGKAGALRSLVARWVTCSLPDFEAHVITLQENDPLRSGPGAYGIGYLASLDFGVTIGLPETKGQEGSGGLPDVGPMSLLEALRVVHFEPCDPTTDPDRVPVAYDAAKYVVPPTDEKAGRCAKQISPLGMAHVLHGIAADPALPETIPGGTPGAVAWFLSKIGGGVNQQDLATYVAAIEGGLK